MVLIPWWKINLNKSNLKNLNKNFNIKNISEGQVTRELEELIQKKINVNYAIATTSGTAAILLILIYLKNKFKTKKEIIISNRAWISPAHAAFFLDLKLVLVDTHNKYPIANEKEIINKINKNTLAIICVQLNGKSVDIQKIKNSKKYKRYKTFILEDAAQSFFSKYKKKFIGTNGNAGILSFSMGKIVSSGQGGAIITNDKELNNKIKLIKNNGIVNRYADKWNTFGLNFKFTDIQASLLINQITKINETAKKLKLLFNFYEKNLKKLNIIKLVHDKNDLKTGCIPLYVECKSKIRDKLINELNKHKIQTRKIYPSLNSTKYFKIHKKKFPNSDEFYKKSFYLPSGPHQEKKQLFKIFQILSSYEKK